MRARRRGRRTESLEDDAALLLRFRLHAVSITLYAFAARAIGGSSAATIASSKTSGRDQRRLERGQRTLEAALREGRALGVLDRAELARQPLARLARDRPLLLPRQLLDDGRVIAQVDLRADDQAGHAGAVVVDLRGSASGTQKG